MNFASMKCSICREEITDFNDGIVCEVCNRPRHRDCILHDAAYYFQEFCEECGADKSNAEIKADQAILKSEAFKNPPEKPKKPTFRKGKLASCVFGLGIFGGLFAPRIVGLEPGRDFGLIAITIWALGGGFVAVVESLRQKCYQRVRDQYAARLFEYIVKNGDLDYCLYLRPFSITSEMPISRYIRPIRFFGVENPAESTSSDFETLIAESLESMGMPMVGLGFPGEHVGAGRILSSNEEWKSKIDKLAEKAELIFLIPATNEGTRWEMEQIASNPKWLSKTAFLMPPCWTWYQRVGRAKSRWDEIKNEFRLPEYNPDGKIFMVNADWSVRSSIPIRTQNLDPDLFAVKIRRMISKPQLSRESANNAIRCPCCGFSYGFVNGDCRHCGHKTTDGLAGG